MLSTSQLGQWLQYENKSFVQSVWLIFNIDRKDISRVYIEIKQRKIDQTKFLDYLRTILQRRIDYEKIITSLRNEPGEIRSNLGYQLSMASSI